MGLVSSLVAIAIITHKHNLFQMRYLEDWTDRFQLREADVFQRGGTCVKSKVGTCHSCRSGKGWREKEVDHSR